MGKVTIIVESDNVSTDKLYNTIKKRITREEFLAAVIRTKYDIPKPDIRMYFILPDED